MSILVKDVCQEMNRFAPFDTQEHWDNSGLLIGDLHQEVTGIFITLDISVNAVRKAVESGCNLIISHHPVIFSGLKSIDANSVVYQLIRQGISAICCHTPLDIADGGINDLIVEKLSSELDLESEILPIEHDGLGRIITLKTPLTLKEFAQKSKSALNCEVVRYSANHPDKIQKIAICSGSGGSLLEDLSGRCDCLLTGDVKHDRWYKAEELHIALLDCGHYHTEVIMIPYVAEQFRKAFPELKILEFPENNPVHYC